MKQRIMLIVAMLLIASPAFATVQIITKQLSGADINVVEVNYVCTNGEQIRAFALELGLSNNVPGTANAVWKSIGNYVRGESNSTTPGYGIFPARFRDMLNPADPNWATPNYMPIPPANEPDSNGLQGNRIVLEMGALYAGDANKPASSGTLCRITVEPNGQTACDLAVTANAIRGGVVDNNGNTVTATYFTTSPLQFGGTCPVPDVVNMLLADANTAINGAGLTVGTITYQADNTIAAGRVISSNPAAGATPACGSAVAMVVSTGPPDCLYVGRVFSGTGITTLTITQAHVDRWVTLGKPNCWCCNAQKRGNGVYTPTSTATKVDALDLAKCKNSAVFGKVLGDAGYNTNACLDTNLSGKIDAVDLAKIKNSANFGQIVGAGSGCL